MVWEERGVATGRELRGAGEQARVLGPKGWKGSWVWCCSKFYRMTDFVDRSAGGSRPSYCGAGEKVGWEVWG